MHYPLLELDGHCASISVEKAQGGRWKAFVTLERGGDFARLSPHPEPVKVPNSYPTDTAAAEAAYAHARMIISREMTLG